MKQRNQLSKSYILKTTKNNTRNINNTNNTNNYNTTKSVKSRNSILARDSLSSTVTNVTDKKLANDVMIDNQYMNTLHNHSILSKDNTNQFLETNLANFEL